MNSEIKIRPATCEDATRLLEIYAPYVKDTFITFEYDVPTLEDFTNRIRTISARYPYLVAVVNGQIEGYAYASAFKSRAAYDWSVETSIYVDMNFHGEGIGSRLYEQLEGLLQKQNICNLCACISWPNPGSVSFHERLGYKQVAHFHKSGYKFNNWYDMVWMEKFIGEHTSTQKPFIPAKEIL